MAQVQNTPTSPRPRTIEFPELKHKKEKMEAFETLQKSNVPTVLEDLLNKICRTKPDDMYGYMSNYFHTLSNEVVISSLSVLEGLDSCGGRSMEVKVYCTVCGVDKLVGHSSQPVDLYDSAQESSTRKQSIKKRKSRGNSPVTSVPVETKPPVDATNVPVKKVFDLSINVKEIGEALRGVPLRKQSRVDRVLSQLSSRDAADRGTIHPGAILAVSCAVAEAAVQLSSQPLFVHLSTTRAAQLNTNSLHSPTNLTLKVDACEEPEKVVKNKKETKIYHLGGTSPISSKENSLSLAIPPLSHSLKHYSMPFPVVASLGQGSGKLKIREICLCPLPELPSAEQVKTIQKIHAEIGKHLASKFGSGLHLTLPNGAYTHALDKFDQALDLIREAGSSLGMRFNTDFSVLIDIGADLLYDEDKGKYELISGQWKSTDEVLAVYSDLVAHSNGSILGFIDPLHPKDVAGWKKLTSKFRNKCVIVADTALKKGLCLAKREQPRSRSESLGASGTSLKVEEKEEGEVPCLEELCCAAMSWGDTLLSTMDKADQLKGSCFHIMLTAPPHLTGNTALADLAVAAGCQFLRLGAPIGMTTLLLNRLLCIHEEVAGNEKLQIQSQAQLFVSDTQQ